MKHLINVLCAGAVIATSLLMCPSAAAARRGEKCFGPRAGYVSRIPTFAAGLKFEYCFSSHVRLSPSVDIYFRNRNKDALSTNINIDFPISMAPKWSFYPLAGIGFTSWGRHSHNEADEDGDKDVTAHTNCFGLNAGAGIEFYAMPALKLQLEGQYKLMRHYPTATVQVGISYVF